MSVTISWLGKVFVRNQDIGNTVIHGIAGERSSDPSAGFPSVLCPIITSAGVPQFVTLPRTSRHRTGGLGYRCR